MMSFGLLLCFVSMCVLALRWRFRRARRLLAHLPSFPSLPLLGNIHFIGDNNIVFNQLVTLARIMEDAMSPFVFWLGPVPVVGVSDPEDVKAVTNTYVEKPYMYQFPHNWLGDGLITAPGSLWKYTSKKLSGVFTTGVVDGYQEVLNVYAQELVNKLKTEIGGKPFDVSHKYIAKMALEMIYEVALGVPIASQLNSTDEFHRVSNRTLHLYQLRSFNPLYHLEFLFRLSSTYRELAKCEDFLNNLTDTIIHKRKIEREHVKKNDLVETEQEHDKATFRPYLDLLLDLSESDPLFTSKQIRSEMNTIIAAGHETVTNTLTMCLLMIGSHPAVQDRLYTEMSGIFGDSKRPITKDDLTRMRYCEAVINETLRMYPAVPVCLRRADRDLELKTCTIPKETVCAIHIWGTGHLKRSWGEDAEVFRPERWLTDTGTTPFFMPFSVGKRSCIGKRYSMAMLKTTLAHCVRELVVYADKFGLRLKVSVSLQPIAGHLIQVQLRNSELSSTSTQH